MAATSMPSFKVSPKALWEELIIQTSHPVEAISQKNWGCLGGAMVLGKLTMLGHPSNWLIVRQGPTALAVGAGWSCLTFFTFIYIFSFPFLPLFGRRPNVD